MHIKGLQKLTLLDYPGRLAATVFFGGCDFRCPFCHNSPLVLSAADLPDIDEASFFSFLPPLFQSLRIYPLLRFY